MAKTRCDTCRFSDLSVATFIDTGAEPVLYCRRYPPMVVERNPEGSGLQGASTMWPIVQDHEWCGEYLIDPRKKSARDLVEQTEAHMRRMEEDG